MPAQCRVHQCVDLRNRDRPSVRILKGSVRAPAQHCQKDEYDSSDAKAAIRCSG